MKKETITRIKLTANDGYVLTNGEVYGKEIYLGVNDSADNWHEITEEDLAEIETAIESKNEVLKAEESEVV